MESDRAKKRRVRPYTSMEFCILFACKYSLVDLKSLDRELILQACLHVDYIISKLVQRLRAWNLRWDVYSDGCSEQAQSESSDFAFPDSHRNEPM